MHLYYLLNTELAMNNNLKTASYLVLAMPSIFLSCSKAVEKVSQRPNIIFIMSDDHTTQAIGAYGSRLAPLNPTPTIDRIGNEGVIMDCAFCTNGISTPSRANIVSGQYSQTNEVLDLGDTLAIERQHLPIEMRKLGYETAVVGKWHLKNLPENYDYYKVFYDQGEYFDPILVARGDTDSVSKFVGGKETMFRGKRYEGHSSDVVMDITLNWLENIRDKSKPFMLCHHFKAPHDLFEFNPRYSDYLEDRFIPEPASLWNSGNNGSVATRGERDSLIDVIGSSVGRRNAIRDMGKDLSINEKFKNLSDFDYKREVYQEYLKRYLRCVKGVDDNVKRLFDYLEANDLMDNTIIMYTGDQGFFLGEHDYIDKRWMYDEGMRMPFMVRYPEKIKAGTHCDAIVNNVDYAETIIDMAGGEVPEYMQGRSFKDILYTGKVPEDWRTATYYRYWMHMAHRHANPAHFGIRTKDYKLIFFYGSNYEKKNGGFNTPSQTPAGWEFYDLKADPAEMENMYDNPKYSSIISDLKSQLLKMREDLNETDKEYPHIQQIIDENWEK
ncbi:MAG: sulfatase [Rikenellaceae bacterium]